MIITKLIRHKNIVVFDFDKKEVWINGVLWNEGKITSKRKEFYSMLNTCYLPQKSEAFIALNDAINRRGKIRENCDVKLIYPVCPSPIIGANYINRLKKLNPLFNSINFF